MLTSSNSLNPHGNLADQSKSLAYLLDALAQLLDRLRLATGPSETPGTPRAMTRDSVSAGALSKVAQDLHDHPGSTRREVARRTRLHPKTAGRAMATLVARGLATRTGDRRGTRWYLRVTEH